MFHNKAWKWLLLGSAITIIGLYMVELTTAGIERVYGPLEQKEAVVQQLKQKQSGAANGQGLIPITEQDNYYENDSYDENIRKQSSYSPIDQEIAALEAEIAELRRQALLKEKQELQKKLLINEEVDKPAVNRIADSTSEVLQKTSQSSIQFIAKLFSNVIN